MIKTDIPNLFDQYSQTENRITNALLQTLSASPNLLHLFLRDFFGISATRGTKPIQVYSQKRPGGIGDHGRAPNDEDEINTIPDGLILCEQAGWAIAIENKVVQGTVRENQLKGHLRQLSPDLQRMLLVLSPDDSEPDAVKRLKGDATVVWQPWKEIHKWAAKNVGGYKSRRDTRNIGSYLLRSLKEYLEMDETLSGFQGIDFSDGFDYVRAKAILKVFLDEIHPRVLEHLYPELTERRGGITSGPVIWDVFGRWPKFTGDLHFTFLLRTDTAGIRLTVPHAASPVWKKLQSILNNQKERKEFDRLLLKTRRKMPSLWIHLLHRHFKGPKVGIIDAELNFNFDVTGLNSDGGPIKPFELWFEMTKELIRRKKDVNLEAGFAVLFPYESKKLKSSEFANVALRTLKDFKDLYRFLRNS